MEVNSTSNIEYITDDKIVSLLSSLKQRAEKSDDLSAFSPSFVPVVDHRLLANNNTQVIYGRNGTGKTHILKCFQELSTYNIQEYRVLPIYFDMRELDISRISPQLKEEDVVELFFSNFIYQCIEKISEFYESYEPKPYLKENPYAIFFKSTSTQSKFRNEIKKLRRAFDKQRMREKIESYTKSIKTKAAAAGSAAANLSAGAEGLTGSAKLDASREASREEFTEMVIKASHFIDFGDIRQGLNNIAEILGLEQIVILIDEWSQLDIDVQPIFSELIRRTICTSNKISCKFAALKFLTSFTTSVRDRRIGLQPGIDITELADLNHIFTFDLDRGAVRHFLIFILVKHLLEAIGRTVYNYDFEDPQKFLIGNVRRIFDRLFEYIFESRDAFDYFVRASEGNPRDFLAMIGECCATHGAAQLPITLKAVQATAINYYTNTKVANFNSSSKNTLQLFEKIFAKCLKNKSKIFSVSKAIDENSSHIKDLWAQRVIHLIDNNYEFFDDEKSEIVSFAIYAVDYGKILGLRSGKKGEDTLDGMVQDTRAVVSGLYDGSTHKTILEYIEEEDSNLAAISEILGSTPQSEAVTDHIDVISPELLFSKLSEINVDDIITGFDHSRLGQH